MFVPEGSYLSHVQEFIHKEYRKSTKAVVKWNIQNLLSKSFVIKISTYKKQEFLTVLMSCYMFND